MLVTPEFHIILLGTSDAGYAPVYGRVYEDDCEYTETIESCKEEEEEEEEMDIEICEEDEMKPPPLPGKASYLESKAHGSPETIVDKVTFSSSPILRIDGKRSIFSYYDVKGADVEKRVIATSLSASAGSQPMLDSENCLISDQEILQSTCNFFTFIFYFYFYFHLFISLSFFV